MKGQIQQVFIYIITIVVVGMILLIGYKAIGGLMSKGCDVEISSFKTNIESFISKYSSYGSVNNERLKAPCSFSQVCFVDASAIGKNPHGNGNSIINESVEAGIEENIFLVKKDLTEPFGYMEEITVNNDVLCIDNKNGNFNIEFEGLGRKTKISAGV